MVDRPGRDERLVTMAVIGAPHGVRGAVRLNVFAAEPLALRRYNPFKDEAGRTLRLTAVRAVGKSVVAEIEGVDDRDAAEALRGRPLAVPRRRLPRPEPEEFYHIDLVGLEARLASGEVVGTVRAVDDYGAGDVIEVVGERTLVLEFSKAVVPEVSLEGGYLVVDPPLELDAAPPEAAEDETRGRE